MFERSITDHDIRSVLIQNDIIAHYPEDKPYPSYLLLGWINHKPVHVLTAKTEDDEIVIITAYKPDPMLWDNDFKKKRP